MEIVTIHAARANLSKLLARVEAGEEIVLARGTRPVAKLVPLDPVAPRRLFGALRGKISVDPGVCDPLPEEELMVWE
jgi:prevent-host-death family protein